MLSTCIFLSVRSLIDGAIPRLISIIMIVTILVEGEDKKKGGWGKLANF